MMSLQRPAWTLAELGKARTTAVCVTCNLHPVDPISRISIALHSLWDDNWMDAVCPSSRTAQCEDSSAVAVDPGTPTRSTFKSNPQHWHHCPHRCGTCMTDCIKWRLTDPQGKTTTTERMLYYSGVTRRIGSMCVQLNFNPNHGHRFFDSSLSRDFSPLPFCGHGSYLLAAFCFTISNTRTYPSEYH